ncbi:major facilitator superfamily domain-containing protein [Apiospora kogelbergensis]|uniref:major facilitator superfamily domain-containing protein n=1 Tax=Apiospora kogelbergensis TaxID=1337665 RepID=UPI00312F92D1
MVGSDVDMEKHAAKPEDVAVTIESGSETGRDDAAAGPQGDAEKNLAGATAVNDKPPPPWSWKITAIVLVSLIRFGGSWSNGITGAMKSTMKKQMHINNQRYALLEASEDFMTTLLILATGLLTDRVGGAGALFWGNLIYSLGSILVAGAAQARSFNFMIGGRIVLAIGDISTQIAQYQVFSSWFAPSSGFASTLGLELMISKLGALAGTGSANHIAVRTGNFAWVFWVAVFINIFTNIVCALYLRFVRASAGKFGNVVDPSTGENLKQKSKKLEAGKIFRLPWSFWSIMIYSLFTTSTAVVFKQNATEMAEQRFKVSAVTAGWYSALLQYAGFFIVPVVGICIDLFGQRVTLMVIGGAGTFIAMALVQWAGAVKGTAAGFGIYAVVSSYSPTVIIDGMRTSLFHQTDFGTAYSLKIMMNNSINIIVRILAGVIQDADHNSYNKVVILYLVLAGCSLFVSLALAMLAYFSVDLGAMQWSRKQRQARAEKLLGMKRAFYETKALRNRIISRTCFGLLICLLLGGWSAYIWGLSRAPRRFSLTELAPSSN